MKGRTVLKSVMWNDLHVSCRRDRFRMLGHQPYVKRRRFFSPLLLVKTGDGENLERTAEVEHFDVFKKDDPNTFPLQGFPPFFETNELAIYTRYEDLWTLWALVVPGRTKPSIAGKHHSF